jgi:hypothetical protein
MMRVVSLLSMVVVVAACCGTAAAASVDAPRIVPWTKIGDVGLGMLSQRVTYEYGDSVQQLPGNAGGFYQVPGGELDVSFSHGRVIDVSTSSPRYVTPSGIHVGSKIPLGRAQNGAYHWNGFTYVRQLGMWMRVWRRGTAKYTAMIYVGASSLRGVPSQPPGVINEIDLSLSTY